MRGAEKWRTITARWRSAAQIGAAHHARHTFESFISVAMDMVAQRDLSVVFLQQVEDGVPVINAVIDWVVSHKNNRLVRVRKIFQRRFEPADILRRPVSIGHFHDRTFVKSDEAEPTVVENKPIFLPNPRKIRRAGFRPLGVVVAGDDVARNLQAIENFFGEAKLFA